MSIRHMKVTVDGRSYDVTVEMDDDHTPIPATAAAVPSAGASIAPVAAARPVAKPVAAGGGTVAAPLAGTVVKVHVKEGQVVSAGQVVVTLEAMKMNTDITAPADGTVTKLSVNDGSVVGEGATLLEIG